MNAPLLEVRNFSVSYGNEPAIKHLNLRIPEKSISAIIGPSGCGKSTLLRAMNRMNDFTEGVQLQGAIDYRGENIYAPHVDPVEVRLRVGMVFQKANPFPKSIFQNVAWGPQINRLEGDISLRVETALKQAALWDEVSDRLEENALNLSGGQQQRLCIARTLAMEPEL
ncbi:MAG: phosphate ABC transporter ATP-binding protein, partial [Pseudomonadales bacterium]